MIIDTNASALLTIMQNLGRIAKENERTTSLLIDARDENIVYASSPVVYGQARLTARIVDPGIQLLPLTLIKYLQKMTDKIVNLDVDLNRIVITEGRNIIEIPQFNGSLQEVSTRDSQPSWLGLDVSRLKNIKYATTDKYDLDVFWLYNGSFVASDKSRVAIFKPHTELDPELSLSIPNFSPGFISGDFIDLGINDGLLWLGSDDYYVSTPESYKKMPTQLETVVNTKEYNNYVSVSQLEFTRIVSLVKDGVGEKDVPSVIVHIDNTDLHMNYFGGDLYVPIVESNLTSLLDMKVNVKMLHEALTKCTHSQVQVGILEYGKFYLMYIIDHDVTHYLLLLI